MLTDQVILDEPRVTRAFSLYPPFLYTKRSDTANDFVAITPPISTDQNIDSL